MTATGSRETAIGRAVAALDEGRFLALLAERVAVPSESQNPQAGPALRAYLEDQLVPWLEPRGFSVGIYDNPVEGGWPLLVA